METVIFKSCRTIHGLCGKVHVQFCTFPKSIHAAYVIHMPHGFGIVETTGAFRNDDVLYALLAEPPDHCFYHQRMRGGGKIRGFRHDEIRLDDDLHLRAQVCGDVQSSILLQMAG